MRAEPPEDAAAARVGRPRVQDQHGAAVQAHGQEVGRARAEAVTAHAGVDATAVAVVVWSAKDHHLTASPPHDTHQAFAASQWDAHDAAPVLPLPPLAATARRRARAAAPAFGSALVPERDRLALIA